VLLPGVETAAEVREAVKAARFRYEGASGDRGLGAPRARRWGLADDYIDREDDETLVGVTVETEAAVENLDAILEVPEVGFVYIGPLDLSMSLGYPGETAHPEVQEAVETIRSATLDAGVPVGGLGFGMDDINEKAASGYQILTLGSTTGAIRNTVTGWIEAFEGGR
jgi:2-dehydro-3-deoxyglucarate aldolase